MIVFTYSFPHKKSQDFILLMNALGYQIEAVVASRPKKLNLPKNKYRYKPVHVGLFEISDLCNHLKIPYYEFDNHNSKDCINLLSVMKSDLGIIAGARILKGAVIDTFSKGVVNFHPGIIPEVRGLDSMLWSLYLDLPIGVTAHFIDERIDAGRVIMREYVNIQKDDTIIDLSLRLYETQLQILPQTLNAISDNSFKAEPVSFDDSGYHKSFPFDLEDEVLRKFELRKTI